MAHNSVQFENLKIGRGPTCGHSIEPFFSKSQFCSSMDSFASTRGCKIVENNTYFFAGSDSFIRRVRIF